MKPDSPQRCTGKEEEAMETSCDKNQLLLDIKVIVPILRVMQEDRDHMAWQQVEGAVTARENWPGFRGREGGRG